MRLDVKRQFSVKVLRDLNRSFVQGMRDAQFVNDIGLEIGEVGKNVIDIPKVLYDLVIDVLMNNATAFGIVSRD